jgi:ABC-type nitrate/sulfonate/bicarbonate transport system permease component
VRAVIDRAQIVVPGTAFIAALLGTLESAARSGMVDRSFIPTPSDVVVWTFDIVGSGKVAEPLLTTIALLLAGYGIGCLLAVTLGILMGNYRWLYNLFEPLTEILRPIPKAALLPVLILFLGLGSSMEITTVALAAFFPVLINTVQGARAVDPVLTDMARTLGHSGGALLWRILLPASAPYIFSGMRISLGVSLVVVIIAEVISGTGGLEDVILHGQRMFLVVDSYPWLIVVATWGSP